MMGGHKNDSEAWGGGIRQILLWQLKSFDPPLPKTGPYIFHNFEEFLEGERKLE